MYMIKIETSYLDAPIELHATNPNSVIVGHNEFTNVIDNRVKIIDTNYYLTVIFDDKISVNWNRGIYRCIISVYLKNNFLLKIKRFDSYPFC